jgi:hypothetical protein
MQPQNALRAPAFHHNTLQFGVRCTMAPEIELHVRRMLSKYPAEVHETILYVLNVYARARSIQTPETGSWFLPCANYLGQFVPTDCII